MTTVEATNEICVAGQVVTPFVVTGTDEVGNLTQRIMVPLTSSGARFRSGMLWADKAMRDMRPSWSRSSPRPRGGWHHDFKSAPVVLEITAAIKALKGTPQRLTRLVDVTGAPLPTFRQVEVRGKNVSVATTHPFYIERSLDTLNWLLNELAKDADVGEPTEERTHNQGQGGTTLDEMATVECSNDASVRWAPSKRAFFTTRGAGVERAVAFFTVRRRACQEEAGMEAEVHHQFERAKHWVTAGVMLPNAPIASKRRRSSPRSRCAHPRAAQADCTSGESEGSRSDVEVGDGRRMRMHSVSPSPDHAAVAVSESGQPSGDSCVE